VANFGIITSGISGSVGEYDATTGAAINSALITGLNGPTGVALAGGSLYVANSFTGTIGKYNLDGAPVNPAFITGLSNPLDLAAFGGNLYVVNNGTNSIGEYDAATGATINAALITGLNDPQGIAIVPEPAAWSLFAVGALGIIAICRRIQN
jgi:DNA-binding beta-propeller fold protein YncE